MKKVKTIGPGIEGHPSKFLSFVKKEFFHVLRDRKTLLILFGMPVVQILIFGFALTNEVKNSKIAIADFSKDISSTQITKRIAASRYFDIQENITSTSQIEAAFRQGKIKLVVVFQEGFNRNLLHQNTAQIQILADASDPNTASTLISYLSSIIRDYQADIGGQSTSLPFRITPEVRMLYNPQLKGAPSFVPGVMALILLLVCVLMTAISIVREKESGTMEVLLVSPFSPIMIIVSKAIPYLILSLINVVSILFLSVFFLELPVNGSLILLFIESTLFIMTCLSLGIFISIKSATQQGAMTVSLMGMMLPTIMLSGFMFPIENMPLALQWVSNIIPSKWFYIIVKSIMIKGIGLTALWKETLILLGMAAFFITISLKSFKIRLN